MIPIILSTKGASVTFGVSSLGRLLVVAHVHRDDVIRIVSARPATRAERKLYEEG
jgi:uncharacterized DUF497 family protein